MFSKTCRKFRLFVLLWDNVIWEVVNILINKQQRLQVIVMSELILKH